MNRRSFLGAASLVPAAVIGYPREQAYKPFGYLSVDLCRFRGIQSSRVVVTLDGHEMKGVAAFDDIAGYVEVLDRDALGKLILNLSDSSIRRHKIFGIVRVFIKS